MSALDKIIIEDDEKLLRRVPFLDPNYIRDDGTPTSLAFSPKKNDAGLSVNVEKLTTYDDSIIDHQRFRLFSLVVSNVRMLNLTCEHDPLPDNAAHALIIGIPKNDRKIPRKMARMAVRYHRRQH